MKAISQTYVLHERNFEDVKDFIDNLMQVRELLSVQFENAEEGVLKRGLWLVFLAHNCYRSHLLSRFFVDSSIKDFLNILIVFYSQHMSEFAGV